MEKDAEKEKKMRKGQNKSLRKLHGINGRNLPRFQNKGTLSNFKICSTHPMPRDYSIYIDATC
jgi:hypothetical protein